MGEGKLDFSQNENEAVNPGEKLWKWKTVEDYAKDIGGNRGSSVLIRQVL